MENDFLLGQTERKIYAKISANIKYKNELRRRREGSQQNRYCCWVLHSSGATQYLVAITKNRWASTGMVLVFDQLNSPRFLRRLPLPLEDFRKKDSRGLQPTISSLGFIKDGEHTGLIIRIQTGSYGAKPSLHKCLYVSDLVNDFQEITVPNGLYDKYSMTEKIHNDCISFRMVHRGSAPPSDRLVKTSNPIKNAI